ncbi:heavy-metal-associated domain-containing protein [Roseivirga sp.]|uniref:heavy-metal-associated domain-containing protein n=1 Tax=Roseivirga sp. TaxID=1964215 RepID=UPI002B26CE44|nr:heavy-metal-associated domain-containing protein [Roseivirga sp.]
MKKAVYKTNINCGMCLSTVTPFLNELKELSEWSVDMSSKDRLLTVEAENIDSDLVIQAVKQAGFKAEKKKSVFGKLF